MTEEKGSHVCLGLMCGLPASGKSTLALQILHHSAQQWPGQLTVLVLQYDLLIPQHLEQQLITQSAEQGSSLWKSTRSQIVICVDFLLNQLAHSRHPRSELANLCDSLHHLNGACESQCRVDGPADCLDRFAKPSSVDFALWERFITLISESLKKITVRESDCDDVSCSWLVLVDDNMHYSSMRYEYCQLARKYEVGLCMIHVSCPLEDALQRNSSRTEGRVDDHVIIVMHERLEIPDVDKRPWEKYSAVVNGLATVDLPPLLSMVQQAMKDPQQPSQEEDMEGKVVSRYVCSTNAIHQADQILRRCVSLRMAEAKGAGLGPGEMKTMSASLATARTAILNAMRTGEITLPFLPDDNSISNSSKDPHSPLYQCVQDLFHFRTNSC